MTSMIYLKNTARSKTVSGSLRNFFFGSCGLGKPNKRTSAWNNNKKQFIFPATSTRAPPAASPMSSILFSPFFCVFCRFRFHVIDYRPSFYEEEAADLAYRKNEYVTLRGQKMSVDWARGGRKCTLKTVVQNFERSR
ncbi:MAG: hypothetical protein BJ554DRAFT_2546 [Olpidium bornovanus]|uniref:Uncharacterized protein n=1 Tax=Olpidium bornovanus TaxID=278681 RepID=A0A8H7ZQN3_9FUNG|nr:MAG: hypothetical protein BJ554DRAFT_2546 [Olpidium bornovanus]